MIPESHKFSRVAKYHNFAISRAAEGFGSEWRRICSPCPYGIACDNRRMLISLNGNIKKTMTTNFESTDGFSFAYLDDPRPDVPASVTIGRTGQVVKAAHYTMGRCKDSPSGIPGVVYYGSEGVRFGYSHPRKSNNAVQIGKEEVEKRLAAARLIATHNILQSAPVVFGRFNSLPVVAPSSDRIR